MFARYKLGYRVHILGRGTGLVTLPLLVSQCERIVLPTMVRFFADYGMTESSVGRSEPRGQRTLYELPFLRGTYRRPLRTTRHLELAFGRRDCVLGSPGKRAMRAVKGSICAGDHCRCGCSTQLMADIVRRLQSPEARSGNEGFGGYRTVWRSLYLIVSGILFLAKWRPYLVCPATRNDEETPELCTQYSLLL